MDRTSVHISPTLPSKWMGVETRLHISSTQSFKRLLHLSLNLPPSHLQTGFYTGQKSTRASHHLYGLVTISINNDKLANQRRADDSGYDRCGRGRRNILFGKHGVFSGGSCCAVIMGFFFFFHFSFKSDWAFESRVVEFNAAVDLTRIKSGLLLRLRGYLKKIKMANLLIGVCLSSGQMCGQSKQQRINLANAAASDL